MDAFDPISADEIEKGRKTLRAANALSANIAKAMES